MRIIAIGLGGAGCRIVDALYSADRRGSKVACVHALAVDTEEESLKALNALPDSAKIYFPPSDPGLSPTMRESGATAVIDINEIVSRIHNIEHGENDAILLCLGFGGGMTDIAPHIVTAIRSSVTEPIFALATLPCLAEGERRSARSADQIDTLSPVLDGMILFDNETWYKKTRAARAKLAKKEKGLAERLGLAKDQPVLSGEQATYHLINEAIVRRIILVLKAGEFRADGGIEMAEVVLDSGEVLNTMKGMGFITIGYAVERLPSNPLAFLAQFRPQGIFDEENKKKASRIVDLAKQAIYHEISTPCDMTSAHKALVLIAGPSHELSMKGFMTVRKWIDRSIAGLEMRSGDYPVMNTKNVAIIVMLSGLENIPRVSELRDIRAQYTASSPLQGAADAALPEGILPARKAPDSTRDEMIVIPAARVPEAASVRASMEDVRQIEKTPAPDHPRIARKPLVSEELRIAPVAHSRSGKSGAGKEEPEHADEQTVHDAGQSGQKPAKHRVVTARDTPRPASQASPSDKQGIQKGTRPAPPRLSLTSDKDAARQRIELELQRQRLKAMAGRVPPDIAAPPAPDEVPVEPARKRQAVRVKTVTVKESSPEAPVATGTPEQRTVIISRRKVVATPPEPAQPESSRDDTIPVQEIPSREKPADVQAPGEEDTRMTVEIRDAPYRAKDHVFKGRDVQRPSAAQAKDAPLIHTNLKPKFSGKEPSAADLPGDGGDLPRPDGQVPAGKKPERKGKDPDDISWV